MHLIPHELSVGVVYFPPLLLDAMLGLVATWVTARLLNRLRVSRNFYYPSLVLIALAVIYTGFLSILVFPG